MNSSQSALLGWRRSPRRCRRRDLRPGAIQGRWRYGRRRSLSSVLKAGGDALVEARYRIDRANRTLAGQSYGALFGLWAAFREPALFANYILTSPSIWFDGRRIPTAEAAYAATTGACRPASAASAPGVPDLADRRLRQRHGPDQARLVAVWSRNYPGLRIKTTLVEDGFL
ncbi:alpha/beta hydrolase-fold protein [Caulobacter segnis]